MLRQIVILLLAQLCFITLHAQIDTIPGMPKSDTLSRKKNADIKISDQGLDSRIVFGSQDSQILDVRNKIVKLFGIAEVDYDSKELKADEVAIEMQNNIAEAWRRKQFNSNLKPSFTDGDQMVNYNGLRYNFETEKGIVLDAIKQEGEFIIHGARTKYLNTVHDHNHEKETVINFFQGKITTCTHEEPHFAIKPRKMKVLSDKLAVFGPSNLELGGVPTPLIIPFGFYPLTQGKSSGFIFPQNYQFNSRELGFGLLGFGWYFPINDYIHVRLTADLYTRGTHGIYVNADYRKNYKYQGLIRLTYNDRRFDGFSTSIINGEEVQVPTVISQKGFSITIDHKQDSKAHPFVNVGGKINVVGNNNQNRNFNDAQSVLRNSYNSNFYYRHSMPGTPFSFNMGLSHNQNTQTGVVNITLPDVQLNMNTIYPFERKNRGSNKEAWFEKITFDYDMKLKSFVQTTDSTLFTREMYDDIKTGMSHSFITGFSTRIFKHFNIVPRATYDETWVMNTIEQRIEQTSSFTDTLVSGVVGGFDSYRRLNAGVSINTQIFGTAEFSKGWFRGIRHIMKPEVGFSYSPDTRSVYTDTLLYSDVERAPEIYTRFENGPFNTPSFNELQSQMNFRINNIIEIKYFSKKDSTIKKMKLFDNVTLSGNYNFAKDSLKWSTFSLNSTSRYFNGISVLTTRWTFDPYLKQNNRSIDSFVWTDRKALVRLERGQIGLATKLTFKKIRQWFSKKEEEPQANERDTGTDEQQRDEFITGPPQGFAPPPNSEEKQPERRSKSLGELFENVSVDHNIVYAFIADEDGNINSDITINSLGIRGSIPLTDNWTVSVGNIGYDFVKNGLTYPAVTFARKLHCWDMVFAWYPNRDTYSFAIGVSSNALSFLKYNYGQNNVDGIIGGRF